MISQIYTPEWEYPKDIKFRQIKLQLWDNSWRQYINPSERRLKRLLLKYQPKNVYKSVNRWVMFKEHNTYPNILLDSDIFIDCDEEIRIKEIQEELSKEYPFLKLKKILVTSENHHHLIYKPNISFFEKMDIIKLKKEIADFLVKEGFKIDAPVCKDFFRVSRLNNTYNGNKNYWCHSLGSPKKTMTREVNNFYLPSEENGKSENKTNLLANYSYNFISNSICGTKNLYVPVIRWQNIMRKRLKKTIMQYRLGSFMLIKTRNYCYIMFFNCFDARRIEKINNFAKSSIRNEFLKYRWIWIPIKNVENYPISMRYYNIEGKGNFSRPHLNFFKIKKDGRLCGGGDLKIFIAKRGIDGEYGHINRLV